MPQFRELKCGDLFVFADRPQKVYEYDGNGWYGWPYSGGPWHRDGNPQVFYLSLENEAHARRLKKAILDDEEQRWARNAEQVRQRQQPDTVQDHCEHCGDLVTYRHELVAGSDSFHTSHRCQQQPRPVQHLAQFV